MKSLRFRSPVWPCLLFLVCSLFFIDKAAHIDDPLFLWSASWILIHPFDFYGLVVNWYGWDMPLHQVTQNPPLTSYYLALLMLAGLKNLVGLHLGMLIPGLLCVWGIHRLSGLFCCNRGLATFMAMSVPSFWIASDSFMADTPLLCIWVWAVYWYISGEREQRFSRICMASLLVGIAILIKINALALVLLLPAYSLLRHRRKWHAAFFLIFPLFTVCAYHFGTQFLYGHSLLFGAMQYSLETGSRLEGVGTRTIEGLAFLGEMFCFVCWRPPGYGACAGLYVWVWSGEWLCL